MADTVADNLAEVKARNVGKTLTALKTASEVVTLASTLAEMKVETAGKTLSDVEAQALLDTLFPTIRVSGQGNWGQSNLCGARGTRRKAN